MWTERVYRALLRLFPTSEREWAADMLETYRRRAAAVEDRGRLVRFAFHLREWGGLAWAALGSRRGRGVALMLGVVGIYGVISYLVGHRRAEIGVRLALGARPSEVRRMVVWEGARVAGVGLAAGMAIALGLTRLMGALLFDVEPTDPLTYAAVGLGLFGVALVASWVPARRAASTDPAGALRAE